MKNEDTLAVVARYFRCLNTEDWDGLAQLWHENAQLDASGAKPRVGPDGALDYLRKALAPYRKHDDAPTHVSVDGGRAAVDVHYVGTTHDGREVVIRAHSDYEVEDHRIVRLKTRYDVDRARADLASSHPGDRPTSQR